MNLFMSSWCKLWTVIVSALWSLREYAPSKGLFPAPQLPCSFSEFVLGAREHCVKNSVMCNLHDDASLLRRSAKHSKGVSSPLRTEGGMQISLYDLLFLSNVQNAAMRPEVPVGALPALPLQVPLGQIRSVQREFVDNFDEQQLHSYAISGYVGSIDYTSNMTYELISNPSTTAVKKAGHIRVATTNVCTLRPKEVEKAIIDGAKLFTAGRITMVERNFVNAGYDIIGVQESRCNLSGMLLGESYAIYSSAADERGVGGVQIRISHTHAGSVVEQFPISNRLMLCVTYMYDRYFVYIVAHAPIDAAPAAEKDVFWSLVRSEAVKISHRFPTATCVLLSDMNARTSSACSKKIGPAGGCHPNDNGFRFGLLLDELDLCPINAHINAHMCTWVATNQSMHRIDYIGISTVDSNSVVECAVAYDVDIAPAVKHDHFSVYVDVDPTCIYQKTKGGECHRANRPRGTQRICKQSLGDEHKCAAFRSSMFDVLSRVHFHDVKNPADLDSTLNFINLKIRNESVRIFGTQKSAPRKPWMSEETFGIVRVASVLRRKMHTVRTQAKFFILRTLTCAWKAVVNEGTYICKSTFLSYIIHKYMMHSAYLAHAIVCVRRAASLRIKQERSAFISGLAMQAEHAAFHNDLRNSYKIVRILGGKSKCNMSKAVKDRNGSLVSDAAGVKLVWQDHFSRVFNASVATFDPSLFPHSSNVTKSFICPVYFDFDEVSDGIRSLGRNKGVGEDRNEAETLVAGGEPIARLLQGVMNASSRLSFAPSQWRGGRLIDLYKGKGDPSVTDNSRGLLIADHASKVFTGLLRKRVEPYYMSYIPREQFGCASARGTVCAAHLLPSFIDYCSIFPPASLSS